MTFRSVPKFDNEQKFLNFIYDIVMGNLNNTQSQSYLIFFIYVNVKSFIQNSLKSVGFVLGRLTRIVTHSRPVESQTR